MFKTDKNKTTFTRRKYFVDPKVQGTLLKQAILSWAWTSMTFAGVILLYRVAPAWLTGNNTPTGQFWYHMGPYVLASAVLLPIILFRSLLFSHRFAGPMVRVRRTLKEIASGESPPPIKFRDDDYWVDLANEINDVAAMVSRLKQAPDCSTSQQDCLDIVDDCPTQVEQSHVGAGVPV